MNKQISKFIKKYTFKKILVILSAFSLLAFKNNPNEGVEIVRNLSQENSVTFLVEQTQAHTKMTVHEEEWNNSAVRLNYDEDMKGGTFTTIETFSEYYLLSADEQQKISVSIIFSSAEPVRGFNEAVKLKAKFTKPHETDRYKIDKEGQVYFSSKGSEDNPDKENRVNVADMGFADNILLNLPVNLHKIGDEQEFNFRCLDHLWMLGPKDIYKKSGKAKLADIKTGNDGHNIAVVSYDFNEIVSTDNNKKGLSLQNSCRIESIGDFDLTVGEWLEIRGTKKQSERYGTEGSERVIEFQMAKKDETPTDYQTLEEVMKEIRSAMAKEKEIVFNDFFETGEGANLKIKNCNKVAPDYDNHKCYKNREVKMVLFEEQKDINRILNSMTFNVEKCKCQKPENFNNFDSDRLPKWKYLVCLKECASE